MIQVVSELCKKAAEVNYSAKYRKGNVICFPDAGKVVVTGDLHGHMRNFEKISTFADLKSNPQTHIVFQEILHGGPEDDFGGCQSFKVFFDVLRYQCEFPEQVHLILGNHDTAIITGHNVLKTGREMNRAMRDGMQRYFGNDYERVEDVIRDYLLSQPVAARCGNGIWISHSLPANNYVDEFDMEIFDRTLEVDDALRPNPAYTLTWGRRHSGKTVAKMAELLDVVTFILGHQPQEMGYSIQGEKMIILASDHNHGCLLSFDLSKTYTLSELSKCIVPLASIA